MCVHINTHQTCGHNLYTLMDIAQIHFLSSTATLLFPQLTLKLNVKAELSSGIITLYSYTPLLTLEVTSKVLKNIK
jgi:hypothetical protein